MLIAAAAAAGFALTLSLGAWQFSRAAQKMALHASIMQKSELPAVAVEDLLGASDPAALLHRRVLLQGQWLAQASIYLENRQMDAKPGFFVVTPLLAEPGAAALLVLRGWAPRNFQDRAALPPVSTPAGRVEVRGLIVPPPSRLYDFGGVEGGAIRQNLDVASFAKELGQPLLALAVQQEGEFADGLRRHWPQPIAGVEKNQGYAFQWFALAGLIAGLYLWFQIVQPLRTRRRKS